MMFMTSSPVAAKAMTLRQPLYQQLNQAPTFSQCKSPKDQIEILIGELKSKRVQSTDRKSGLELKNEVDKILAEARRLV